MSSLVVPILTVLIDGLSLRHMLDRDLVTEWDIFHNIDGSNPVVNSYLDGFAGSDLTDCRSDCVAWFNDGNVFICYRCSVELPDDISCCHAVGSTVADEMFRSHKNNRSHTRSSTNLAGQTTSAIRALPTC
jgi:hypothetical protein